MHNKSVVHLDLKPENIMCHNRTSHQVSRPTKFFFEIFFFAIGTCVTAHYLLPLHHDATMSFRKFFKVWIFLILRLKLLILDWLNVSPRIHLFEFCLERQVIISFNPLSLISWKWLTLSIYFRIYPARNYQLRTHWLPIRHVEYWCYLLCVVSRTKSKKKNSSKKKT